MRLTGETAQATENGPMRLAEQPGVPKRLSDVLLAELDQIEYARTLRTKPPESQASTSQEGDVNRIYEEAWQKDLVGLAFSGGGIRSATFNLGILQALANLGVLRSIDYLSTVSGGGYIGSWLITWIKRVGFNKVIDSLKEREPDKQRDGQVEPISFLRNFSSYLTPETGFFSADTWTMLMIWFRNTLLNQVILLSFLSLVLLLPRFFEKLVFALGWAAKLLTPDILFAAVIALLAFVAYSVGKQLKTFQCGSAEREQQKEREKGQETYGLSGVSRRVLLPLLGAAVIASSLLYLFIQAIYHGSAPGNNELLRTDFRLMEAVSEIGASWVSSSLKSPSAAIWIGCVLGGIGLFGLLLAVGISADYTGCYCAQHTGKSTFRARVSLAGICIACAVAGMVLLRTIAALFEQWYALPDNEGLWHLAGWGVPLFLLMLGLVIVLQTGLMGLNMPDDRREWWSRLGAWLVLLAIASGSVFAISVYAPKYVGRLIAWGSTAAETTFTGAWLLTTIGGLLAGRSSKTGTRLSSEPNQKSVPAELLATAGPYAFVLGLLIGLSCFLNIGLVHAELLRSSVVDAAGGRQGKIGVQQKKPQCANNACCCAADKDQAEKASQSIDVPATKVFEEFHNAYFPAGDLLDLNHWKFMSTPSGLVLGAVWAGLAAICLLFAWRVDINEFSLHHFYRNRLVRCYLGASNPHRNPNPFTGFDRTDDYHLARFVKDDNERKSDPHPGDYAGPYPIINAAFNFTQGGKLAYQERKAASFVFTPLYCGYISPAESEDDTARTSVNEAYQPTENYGYPNLKKEPGSRSSGIHVGTAMAISGAAASPNMGYHTSPPIAFLLTIFNVRLGWWLANTRSAESGTHVGGPRFGFGYLLRELFGQTTPNSAFSYLSDGGHFDNMGIYELVRRRCRIIIVGDGEQDERFTFGGLGMAIRKCRVDFGVDIDIDVSKLRNCKNGLSEAHFAVGKIRYPDGRRESAREGTLLYFKSSRCNDQEPVDVWEYAAREPSFPHQTTGDQSFDESQFESYRALGEHVVRHVLTGYRPSDDQQWKEQLRKVKDARPDPAKAPDAGWI